MATKQEILSKLAASHEQRISKVLFDLEEDIIAQLQRATDGVPLTTDLAIQLRPNLKRLIEQNYLKEGSRIISEYDEVVKGYMDYIRTTPVSAKFKTLTKPDLVLINQLKQLSFSGFEDVANRFLDTIATEIYSSAVTGKPFPQVVENIRASINGVYRRSNEEAVNRLVRIIEENRYSDDPLAKKKYLDARKILHSKYASDIRGENMRKYANQIAHDSIMQFDGQFTKYKGQEAGINTYKYTGTNITTTRQFCRAYLNEIKTEEEWREVFTGNWRGKSGSDPFVNRGGYRCRHSLIPYDPAWDADEEVKQKVDDIKPKTKPVGNIPQKNIYSPFPNTNGNSVNKILNDLDGNEESTIRINNFINARNIGLNFLPRATRNINNRRKELPKVQEWYGGYIKENKDTFKYGNQNYPIQSVELGSLKGRKTYNGWATPLNNMPIALIDETTDLSKVDVKKLQDSVAFTLDRTKKSQGKYVSRLNILGKRETKNADWSFSANLNLSKLDNEQKFMTMMHEIGHQVHYYAVKNVGTSDLITTNGVSDVINFIRNKYPNSKDFILTKYGSSNAHEFHAELFAAYSTNRKALEKFNKGLVEYMDDLIEKATQSKVKGH